MLYNEHGHRIIPQKRCFSPEASSFRSPVSRFVSVVGVSGSSRLPAQSCFQFQVFFWPVLTPYFRYPYRYKVTLSNQSINNVNNVRSSSALPVSGRFGKQMTGKLHQVSLVNLILHLQICPLKTYSPGKKINFILLLNHFALCESAQWIFPYIQLGDC